MIVKIVVWKEKWGLMNGLCGVHGKGVLKNSIKYTSCKKWIYKRCSAVESNMNLAAIEFLFNRSTFPAINADSDDRLVGESVDSFSMNEYTCSNLKSMMLVVQSES